MTGPHEEFAKAVARSASGADDGERALDKGILRLAASSARSAGAKAVTSGKWASEVALEVASHIPVRDLAALRAHHHGLAGSLLAGTLIRSAARATSAVGAATGALAAVSEATPATWVSLPVELAAETLIVVAIEMKLVGELHEAAGVTLPDSLRIKGPLVAKAWAESRGIAPQDLVGVVRSGNQGSLSGAAAEFLGRSARDQLTSQLRRRILRRSGKNLATFTPLLIGAAAGAALNRRATRNLGIKVATSLNIPPPAL